VSHPAYQVYVSPVGNVFMTEIAEMVVHSIEESGREVSLLRHGLPKSEPGTINLVVAPHEYFTLITGFTEAAIVRAAAQCITLGVEQPGTQWFELGARYASFGPLAIDINRRGASELRRRGLEVYRLAPGYYSGWDLWGGNENSQRERDVLFLGSITPRRGEFLARSASVLTQWNCDLRLFSGHQPIRQATSHFVIGRDKYELLGSSRVLLNVHQGDRDYFEWIRVLEAITNGCMVVAESSGGYAPLVPSEHFVQAPLETLAGQLDAVLRDEPLRSKMAQDAYEFIRKHMNFVDGVDQLLQVIERRHGRDAFHTWRSPAATSVEAPWRSEARRTEISRPGPVPSAAEIAQQHRTSVGNMMNSAVKDLMLAEIAEARSIESLLSALTHGAPDHASVSDTPAYLDFAPQVSVVLTHYNYETFVVEAVESVIASDGVRVELVIVDDHSEPPARQALADLVEQYSWFPIRLVSSSANHGPSGARNLGARHARGEFLFLLDADNMVFPRGLQLLHDALVGSDAAFAYGLIERFGADAAVVSALPWDLDLLVQGNYIDTMALVRRQVWNELGGFDPQADLMGGWDDYEFWLNMASEGHRGLLVPQFIGRYRAHETSWQSIVNLDTNRVLEYLRNKHRHLPWPTQE
jgi:GT2 family glycosyltransferase